MPGVQDARALYWYITQKGGFNREIEYEPTIENQARFRRILEAIVAANAGDTAPYGADPVTEGLAARFGALFETAVEVYPVGTGTAANGLCAAIVAAPYGAIYLSDAAHLHGSECGGPEFWSGGNARTIPVPSADGKIVVAELARMVDEAGARPATEVPPRAVSITQGTEASTVYTLGEVRAIADVARARHMWVHMDGARLANAVARLGCTPAEATWKAGVDVLSFGATKNGALAAEAVVFFNRELAQSMRYRRRRGGHGAVCRRLLAGLAGVCLVIADTRLSRISSPRCRAEPTTKIVDSSVLSGWRPPCQASHNARKPPLRNHRSSKKERDVP